MLSILRWLSITIAAIVIATLGLNAFDNLDQPANSLLGSAASALMGGSRGPCPSDMAFISTSNGDLCIDRYEAAAGGSCPHADPQGRTQTDENFAEQKCQPVSAEGAIPWRHISQPQAELACARAGKRLPSNQEWYRAALGTLDRNDGWGRDDCNVNVIGATEPDPTGSRGDCASPAGVYDMIGNVWEWVDGTVYDGMYDGRPLPEQGYVTNVDSGGIPLATSEGEPSLAFFSDYFWINVDDARGIVRGGYWGNKADAGLYAMNAVMEPSFAGNAIGFRCVKATQ